MSWTSYITTLTGDGGADAHMDKAAIISIAGDSVWASSEGFTISAAEMSVIATITSGNQDVINKAYAEGIYVAGERYLLARAEDGSLYARKDKDGILASRAKQCILVGHHRDGQQPGNAKQVLETIKDHLVVAGY